MSARVAGETFGSLVRQHRLRLGLTQEGLAERAGLSARGVQDQERGLAMPHRDTLQRMVAAFGLTGDERVAFEAAAAPRPRRHLAEQLHDSRTNLPADIATFVGRESELTHLAAQLAGTRLLTLAGPGGVGKTRLALRVAAHFFGDWVSGVNLPVRSRHSRAEVLTLLKPLDLEVFNEIERDGLTAQGHAAHWHMFEVVARKRA